MFANTTNDSGESNKCTLCISYYMMLKIDP